MKSPVTPRTMAFNKLGGMGGGGGGAKKGKSLGFGKKGRVQELRAGALGGGGGRVAGGGDAGAGAARRELPLRHHISMGEETYNGK